MDVILSGAPAMSMLSNPAVAVRTLTKQGILDDDMNRSALSDPRSVQGYTSRACESLHMLCKI